MADGMVPTGSRSGAPTRSPLSLGYASSRSPAPSSTKKKSIASATATGTVPSGNGHTRSTASEPFDRGVRPRSRPACATHNSPPPGDSNVPGPPIANGADGYVAATTAGGHPAHAASTTHTTRTFHAEPDTLVSTRRDQAA